MIISYLSRYRERISSCEEINAVGVGYYEYESVYTSINVYSSNVIFVKRGANYPAIIDTYLPRHKEILCFVDPRQVEGSQNIIFSEVAVNKFLLNITFQRKTNEIFIGKRSLQIQAT